jgi:hypothetical protein
MNNARIVSPPAVVTIDDVVTAIDAIGGRNRDATCACYAEALRAGGTYPLKRHANARRAVVE